MAKKKITNKLIHIPGIGFEWGVNVCWGSPNFIKKVAKKYHHFEKNPERLREIIRFDECDGHTVKTPHEDPLIILNGYPKTTSDFDTLAHEAVHAVNGIFDFINAEYNDEIFALMVGNIVGFTLSKGK